MQKQARWLLFLVASKPFSSKPGLNKQEPLATGGLSTMFVNKVLF